ncbi:ferric reductase [Bifidobacterium amazonense]|uniref:Ferric reductase n=1 Tax=Bifidobacterium amazonense TaxID=2809027 RepID=A0ABS9VY03_9BIFI|nr:ferric reductase [Bifidobacterium amazonense]MCH9276801.1 ferric reductase [Bifidobacterium amazonense]
MTRSGNLIPARLAAAWIVALAVVPAPFVATMAAFIRPVYRTAFMTPIALGVIAYVWMLEAVYLSCRPRWLDRLIGLPNIYMMHGVLGMLALILAAFHRADLPAFGPAKMYGNLAFWLLLAVVVLAVIFMARWIADLIPPIGWLKRQLERVFRHEINVWLHRIILIAVVLVCLHFHAIRYIVTVTPFIVLTDAATIAVLAWYAYSRWHERFGALHGRVISCTLAAPNVCRLTVRVPGISHGWEEGDFAFLRFPRVNGMKEYHPFSMANMPNGEDEAVFLIRGDGDFTRRLPTVAAAGTDVDMLPPFGRYRRFLDEHGGDRPIVVFAGGIGVTPLLPIIFRFGDGRRPVRVMYCAHDENGLLCRDELESWSQRTGSLLTLKVGRFTAEELRSAVTPDAVYLIAGPTGMTRTVRRVLRKAGVSAEDICYEPFAW